jgi:hypothetical protein
MPTLTPLKLSGRTTCVLSDKELDEIVHLGRSLKGRARAEHVAKVLASLPEDELSRLRVRDRELYPCPRCPKCGFLHEEPPCP